MPELFSNLGQTTINQIGGIGATDTTVTVAALNGTNAFNSFPSSGNFRVVFGNDASSEIALCTAVDTTNRILTIVRGQEGTLPKAWTNGTAVTVSLTAQAVNQMRTDLFQVGSYVNRPAQGLPTGSYFQPTDGHSPWIWDPGLGAWRPQITGILGMQPPPASTFNTSVQAASQTIADSGKGALIYNGNPDGSNTINFRGFCFSPPGGVGFAEVAFIYEGAQAQATSTWWETGVFFKENATGKIILQAMSINLAGGTDQYLSVNIYSNLTTRTSFTSYNMMGDPNAPVFLRVRRDTTKVYTEWSRNRVDWSITQTNTIASIFTTAPDQIGFGGFSAGGASFCKILHWNHGPIASVPNEIFTPNIHQLRGQIFMPPPNPPPQPSPTGWIGPVFHQ